MQQIIPKKKVAYTEAF